jgi:hypothetical protein
MLNIREAQMSMFRQAALRDFEDQMVEHLKAFSSKHWDVMGEQDGRRVIRLGIEQARLHGFTNRGPIRFYIELMFMFGSYFDSDPQYPWAGAALKGPDDEDQSIRAERLYTALNKYLADVFEPEREHLRGAVQKLIDARIEDLLKPGLDIEEMILGMLRSVCPLRGEYLGEAVLRVLIQHGFGLAHTYGLATDKGMVLMVTLTLAVGHGFSNDPLYGWIVRRLNRRRWPDPDKRVDELSSKSIIYLKHILAGESEG